MKKSTLLLAAAVAMFAGLDAAFAQTAAKPALGITMSDNLPGGVLITAVYSGSPADKMGLEAGDRILSINGQNVSNYRDVMRLIAANPVGAEVKVEVARGTWRNAFSVSLSQANQVFQTTPIGQRQPQQQYAPAYQQPYSPFYPASGQYFYPQPQNPGNYYNYSPADIDDQHGYGSG